MTKKERNQILALLDEIKALVLLDERTNGERPTRRGHPSNTPEHMEHMRKLRAQKAIEAKRQRLWAELEKLEGTAGDKPKLDVVKP